MSDLATRTIIHTTNGPMWVPTGNHHLYVEENRNEATHRHPSSSRLVAGGLTGMLRNFGATSLKWTARHR
jgi:hypothetical protein